MCSTLEQHAMEIRDIKNIFKTLSKGQSIHIKTEKQELVGRLHQVDIGLNSIFLDTVKDFKTNVEYTSRQMIPVEMIKYIWIRNEIEDVASEDSTYCNSSFATANNQSIQALPESCYACPTVDLNTYEIKLLENRINNPVVINQSGPQYVQALTDIRAQQFVALLVEPTKYGRNFKTSIITVATVQAVYIFDIISLGKLFGDFKSILESEVPRKVIHGSHLVADHFKYQQNVDLNGVFDSFAAYCIVTKQKRFIDFVDICEQFFHIDKQYFKSSIDDSEYPHNIFRRPLNRELIKECAKRACLILKLQEHLQNKMLSKFYSQCKNFSQTFVEIEDNAFITEAMQINKSAGFDKISGLDPNDQTI